MTPQNAFTNKPQLYRYDFNFAIIKPNGKCFP